MFSQHLICQQQENNNKLYFSHCVIHLIENVAFRCSTCKTVYGTFYTTGMIVYFKIFQDKVILMFQALQYGDGECKGDVDRGTKNW